MHARTLALATLAGATVLATACAEQSSLVDVDPEVESASFSRGNSLRHMDGTMIWTTNLKPLNAHVTERAVTGKATFIVDLESNTFTAITDVRGVAPDRLHPQHIHGFLTGEDATCPTPQADDDGDKIVSLLEGAEVYGGVLVPLDKDLVNEAQQIPLFPEPEDYTYHYEETVPLSELYDYPGFGPGDGFSFERRHVVVHGAFVNGEYNILLPVACGELRRVR